MQDLRKFGSFLGAMASFTPSFVLGSIHYTISLLEGKEHKDASNDFKRTFDKLFNLGEQLGSELTEGAVKVGSKIFNGGKNLHYIALKSQMLVGAFYKYSF
ncbi:hypothetical protein [Emticicia sp. BO119]|uniref:hypothetical protein n=1 Tax=Emticicia sp. BO119 TaxID=2757768 RepID=UPI0015F006B3|nr:hypothetical protein [Emticicia sp. BO119]MBA4849404.1 hypothetical protein [Emticicia sp. BO119]